MKFLILTLFLSGFVYGSVENAELELYSSANELGIVARRIIRNESQQPTKIIYYRSKEAQAPAMIHLLTYQDGKEVWMGEYSEKFHLLRSLETIYGANGDKIKTQWRDPDGIVRYVMLWDSGKIVSHLYYNQSGTEIETIRGKIPEGIDISNINITR
jgi:hypothetical protein